jgi:serine/threonine-protein kinase RsbW
LPEEKYSIEIESDPDKIIIVEEFVNYFAKDLKIEDDKIPGLILAVTEATTNAIIHGNKKDINKLVTITARLDDGFLIVIVKDQGRGFNPGEIPDPTSPENLLKDSGRGIYLMRVYMDDIKYNLTSEGTETILTMKI